MRVPESVVRDKLSEKLEIIERGLERLDVEHYLPNRSGANGFVDILARDRFGVLVLVELKKSDSSARQAIHELFKYVALIGQNYGLSKDRLRCIVVSTRWHELAVPFFEYQRSVGYDVMGIALTIDAEGCPVSAVTVSSDGLHCCGERISPYHRAICFNDIDSREKFVLETSTKMMKAGVNDFIRIMLTYCGDDCRIINRHCDYVVVAKFSENEKDIVIRQNIIPVGGYEDNEDSEWAVEEFLLGHMPVYASVRYDDASFSTGAKFVGMLNSGWVVERCIRYGNKFPEGIFSDEDMIIEVSAVETINDIFFRCIASPKNIERWGIVLRRIPAATVAMPNCSEFIRAYLTNLSNTSPESSASISIYNPGNIVMGIVMCVLYGDLRAIPSIMITESSTLGEPVSVLHGTLFWNGSDLKLSPQEIFTAVVSSDIWTWRLAQTLNEVCMYEESFLNVFGLSYKFVVLPEEVGSNECIGVTLEGLGIRKVRIPRDSLQNVICFITHNWNSICDLVDHVLADTHGIDPLERQILATSSPFGERKYWMSDVTPCCICGRVFVSVFFDTRIPHANGAWGLLCRHCFTFGACRIGLGYGQRYDIQPNGQWLLTAGDL
ncbi:MAG: DUF91 domain-containing protein [Proteobacteria bacterium]|nr:DUF91 domain-containing protein [Pseudomonadota bacterium]MBU1595456.1 DUF91 domain-containing protein [Pseudomonadota bacterium]